MKAFGTICRELRLERGLTQKDVAVAGRLDQARISEIEHGRYTPGLDQAARLAKGLGVTLADLVGRWEGTVAPGTRARAIGPARPAGDLDVPQRDLFRRLRGLWEDMSEAGRAELLRTGRTILTAEWTRDTPRRR